MWKKKVQNIRFSSYSKHRLSLLLFVILSKSTILNKLQIVLVSLSFAIQKRKLSNFCNK